MPLDDAEAAQLLSRIARLSTLLTELEALAPDASERTTIRDRMRQELDARRAFLRWCLPRSAPSACQTQRAQAVLRSARRQIDADRSQSFRTRVDTCQTPRSAMEQ